MRMEDVMRAANRYEVLSKVGHGVMGMQEAADILGVSKRQCRRLRRRSESVGLKGLLCQRVHVAWNRVPEDERERILELRREPYGQYNLLHFRDVLARSHGITRSREYYRTLFKSEGLYTSTVKRRVKRHHRKRFEAPQAGILIQRDTSIHLWVPGARKPWKLIVDLDDHSRKITGACFSWYDDVMSNMAVAWETVDTHGLPASYYTDNNPIFNPLNHKPAEGMYSFYRRRDREERGEEVESTTQFKRALKELGIGCIHATPYQPQGKGKIERLFRFMQDRLVREMETAKVTTIAEGNRYLRKWVNWYNHHHLHSITTMIPNERYIQNNAFRRCPRSRKLADIFCLKYQRRVKADNTFQLEGQTYQIPGNRRRLSYARALVEIRVYLTQKVQIFYKGQKVGEMRYKTNKNNALEDILALQ